MRIALPPPPHTHTHTYIIVTSQMEYCENQTLRQLIDQGELHSNEDRVWRLFREIVEGLEHIHSKVWKEGEEG